MNLSINDSNVLLKKSLPFTNITILDISEPLEVLEVSDNTYTYTEYLVMTDHNICEKSLESIEQIKEYHGIDNRKYNNVLRTNGEMYGLGFSN